MIQLKLRISENNNTALDHGIYYKNVDVCDLNSILSNGILSLSTSGNDNWYSGKRANNSKDVVYLFRPTGFENSFVQYGIALLEVEVDGVQNEFVARDVNKGKYIEYVCDSVPPENIISIYIPKIFRNKIKFNHPKVKWVEVEAEVYDWGSGYVKCSDDLIDQFAKTVSALNTGEFNYLRGEYKNREVLDLSHWHYDI